MIINREQIKAANEYRKEKGFNGGVVLLFNGEPYGWKNALRNPDHEQPGALAIDEKGNQWVARGGDSYNGAERWDQIAINGVR